MRYWDYYSALEFDLKQISRYIEFSDENLKTFSTELTRIILSSRSEIEVILKEICYLLDEEEKPNRINEYQRIIKKKSPNFILEKVNIGYNFFGIEPWIDWSKDKTPLWWKRYNDVKHERNKNYMEANLDNAIKSVSALFICVNYFYKTLFSQSFKELKKPDITFKEITFFLKTDTSFIKFVDNNYYVSHLRIN